MRYIHPVFIGGSSFHKILLRSTSVNDLPLNFSVACSRIPPEQVRKTSVGSVAPFRRITDRKAYRHPFMIRNKPSILQHSSANRSCHMCAHVHINIYVFDSTPRTAIPNVYTQCCQQLLESGLSCKQYILHRVADATAAKSIVGSGRVHSGRICSADTSLQCNVTNYTTAILVRT